MADMTTPTPHGAMPELPKPHGTLAIRDFRAQPSDPVRYRDVFTAEQMHAYAEECARAASGAQCPGAVPEYHLIERIAQHWDACIYNTDDGEMDIGAAIRQNAKLFASSLAPPKQQPTEIEALRTRALAMDVSRLQGRLEAFAMALTECSKATRHNSGSIGERDCSEIRTAIDILHLNTLKQIGKLK